MFLRKAKLSEAHEILNFYENVIDSIENSEFNPKWNENYPNLEFIRKSISSGGLQIFKPNNKTLASIVINNEFSKEYNDIAWLTDSKSDETIILHAFAINPNHRGEGIEMKIFDEIKENALKNNIKSIRIDVIDGNDGTMKFFEHLGFEYVNTIEIFHNAVGLEKFHLYEFPLC
ncbi:GNAT family N-acetyltransferase [uncultured Methanobrevibacter sp.]|uniref:GNAT family N-acetyltransferase n=1 Tax=uncultured Methanobrevibacter sp. TaxID=253161 RepID=UPI0025F2EB1B|nr:GNAT family N-acetyltransferase [uncultured Methanobrevibacter sp.]